MAYIKYGFLAAVLLIVTILVFSTPAKESISGWVPAVVPEKTVTNANFSAVPTSGSAPLKVTFSAKVPSAGHYEVTFGDGTAPLSLDLSEGLCIDGDTFGACGLSLDSASHVYMSVGTYTATLYTEGPSHKWSMDIQKKIIGTAPVTVAGAR
ncbi:MAG TPA: hypothetical protein VJG64_03985 [Candidatus Paceibacterota bacterium]